MKLLLIHGDILPQSMKIEFLKKKRVPFFIYKYDEISRAYFKRTDFVSTSLSEEIIITLKDYGNKYLMDVNRFQEDEYNPHFDTIRYDLDLIELVESHADRFEGIDVVEVPDGAEYRIFMTIAFGLEYLELKNDIDWLTAKEVV